MEVRVQELGQEIFRRSQSESPSLFNKAYWSGRMMEWSMKSPQFKVEMFRFVDVLPCLKTSDQLVDHVREYFLRDGLEVPAVIKASLGAANLTSFTAKMAAATIKKNVESMADIFITGENSATAHTRLEKLWSEGTCFTVDILGESVVSEPEALHYQARYIELIEGLSQKVKSWPTNQLLESSPLGSIPRANVSVKCSSLYSQMDNVAFDQTVSVLKERLRPILRAAIKNDVFIYLDMEQYDYRELLLKLSEEIFSEDEFASYRHFGLVLQAYLKSALDDVERIIALSRSRKAPLSVRLVKGAYWDYEVIQSLQRNWEVPVHLEKAASDATYERCTEKLLSAYPAVQAAFGSHNVRSLAFAMACAESLGLEKTAFEIQMLFGMADTFKHAVTQMGYRVREYAPVGEILPGMAYLVRRLLENTSNEGFLRAKHTGEADAITLLKNPTEKIKGKTKIEGWNPMFVNEPLRDFTKETERSWIPKVTASLRKKFPIQVPAIVGGDPIEKGSYLEVSNPSKLSEVLSKSLDSTVEIAEQAVQACEKAKTTWMKTSVETRVAVLRRAAQIMRDRKNELTAMMVLEAAKNYREADGDVAEGIDFCDYYAQQMERLSGLNPTVSTPGESNKFIYEPRGLTLAISPWNFPFAILAGMTVGPLVAGNPVIMKPAEQSNAIALELYNILREAGVPGEALQLVPGRGEVVGAHLVAHPKVHAINFTGSRDVGLMIMAQAAKLAPGQKHLKKVVAELGGKNAVIVDDDADLDEAVAGVLHSAFGFQGQKCSACSRVIILEPAYEGFKKRLVEALQSLRIGPADDVTAKVNPVIDAEARKRLMGVLERNASKIVGQLTVPEELKSQGHFVPPTVFEESDFQSELGQAEMFGPMVALFKVKTFDEAIRALNGVDYALTGGIFSRNPTHLERAKKELEVGNLYINRGITGALVCRQPFGGFKLSGCGAKAGGPDYLLQFLEPRTITENTMRRGFAPEI